MWSHFLFKSAHSDLLDAQGRALTWRFNCRGVRSHWMCVEDNSGDGGGGGDGATCPVASD